MSEKEASPEVEQPSSPSKEEDAAADTKEEAPAMKRKSEDTKKSKAVWTAAEDDALLKAVLEDQQDREAEGDGDEEEDWDEIAKSVTGKTPVQCLKRYLVLNQKQSGAPSSDAAGGPAAEMGEEAASPAAKKQKVE